MPTVNERTCENVGGIKEMTTTLETLKALSLKGDKESGIEWVRIAKLTKSEETQTEEWDEYVDQIIQRVTFGGNEFSTYLYKEINKIPQVNTHG